MTSSINSNYTFNNYYINDLAIISFNIKSKQYSLKYNNYTFNYDKFDEIIQFNVIKKIITPINKILDDQYANINYITNLTNKSTRKDLDNEIINKILTIFQTCENGNKNSVILIELPLSMKLTPEEQNISLDKNYVINRIELFSNIIYNKILDINNNTLNNTSQQNLKITHKLNKNLLNNNNQYCTKYWLIKNDNNILSLTITNSIDQESILLNKNIIGPFFSIEEVNKILKN